MGRLLSPGKLSGRQMARCAPSLRTEPMRRARSFKALRYTTSSSRTSSEGRCNHDALPLGSRREGICISSNLALDQGRGRCRELKWPMTQVEDLDHID